MSVSDQITYSVQFNKVKIFWLRKFEQESVFAVDLAYFISEFKNTIRIKKEKLILELKFYYEIIDIKNQLLLDRRKTYVELVSILCHKKRENLHSTIKKLSEIDALDEVWIIIDRKRFQTTSPAILPIVESKDSSTFAATSQEQIIPNEYISNQKKIIRDDFVLPLYELLRSYFNDSENDELLNSIRGNIPKSKLQFFNDGIMFCDIFWFFSQDHVGILVGQKIWVANWISNSFRYIKKETPRDFDLENVKKILSSKRRICQKPMPGLNLFSTNENQ